MNYSAPYGKFLSLLTIPYVIQCGHSFCRDCIQNYGKMIKSTKCPLCKLPFNLSRINLNVSLQAILNLIENDTTSLKCDLSRKKSSCINFSICASNISDEYKEYFERFAKQFKIKTNSNINPRVTHLIAGPADPNQPNVAKRTIKYLTAVVRGIWIVNIDWVIESLKCDTILSENDFEMKGDEFAFGSPKLSRTKGGMINLFEDFLFYVDCCNPNSIINGENIETLIKQCGGTLTSNKSKNNITIIVKIVPEPQLNRVWRDCNPIQINQRWIFDSISQFRVQSFYEYLTN